ncbi:MAG TPA: SRPBCC domain-containing protein [Ktedonobacteraceae bacterium]|jgi:hypothetical protein|nr:SRPBCC domain-containing protein [Ktedonobacteraceae bacterium]
MKEQNYHRSITANISPAEAFEKISRVSEWWSKNFAGTSQKPEDVFTVRFSSGDMYKAKVSEILPDHKIIWEFIDAYQGWVKNPTEWVGTKIIWEIMPQKDSVEVKMTHIGLAPELECFHQCTKGWNYLMLESLLKFLNEGQGHPA